MDSIVTLYRNENSIVTDAFDRTIFNICLQKEKFGHKTFLLCGCEPRVGTTTVSAELSIALSLAGWKVLLMDGNFRKEKEYKRLSEGLTIGMAEYIAGKVEKKDIIKKTNWEGLDYLSSGNVDDATPLHLLYANKMVHIIDEVKNDYDFVIVDAPALNAVVDASILAVKTDATILVAAMNGKKRKMLEQTYEQMCAGDVNVIGVIENRVSMKEYKNYITNFNYFRNKIYAKKKNIRRKK